MRRLLLTSSTRTAMSTAARSQCGSLPIVVEEIQNIIEIWMERNAATTHHGYRADIRDYLNRIKQKSSSLYGLCRSEEKRADLLKLVNDCLIHFRANSVEFHWTPLRSLMTQLGEFERRLQQTTSSAEAAPDVATSTSFTALTDWLDGDNSSRDTEVPSQPVDQPDQDRAGQETAGLPQPTCSSPTSPGPSGSGVDTVRPSAGLLDRQRSSSEETVNWENSQSASGELKQESGSDVEIIDVKPAINHQGPVYPIVNVKQEPSSPTRSPMSFTMREAQTASPPTSGQMQTAAPSTSGQMQTAAPSTSGWMQTAAPSTSGQMQTAAPSTSGQMQTAAPSTSGQMQTAAPSTSGQMQTAAPATSGWMQTVAPTTSRQMQTAAPSTSGQMQTAAPATSGWMQTVAPTTSRQMQTAAPSTSGQMQTAAPSTSGQPRWANQVLPTLAFKHCGSLRCLMCKYRYQGCKVRDTVYYLTCVDCDEIYVGESAKRLGTIFEEHMKQMKYRAALAEHLKTCPIKPETSRPKFRPRAVVIVEDKKERSERRRLEVTKLPNPINLYNSGKPRRFPKGSGCRNSVAGAGQGNTEHAPTVSASVSITAVAGGGDSPEQAPVRSNTPNWSLDVAGGRDNPEQAPARSIANHWLLDEDSEDYLQ